LAGAGHADDGGDADTGAGDGGIPDVTGKLIAASEQIKAATGVDLAAALRARAGEGGGQ
jgi:hypothetical protein